MLMNIGLGQVRREMQKEMERERERKRKIKKTEGGRMEEDNGFSSNKCSARGTCWGGEKSEGSSKKTGLLQEKS